MGVYAVVMLLAGVVLFVIIYLLNLDILLGVALRRILWGRAMRDVFDQTLQRWHRTSDDEDIKRYSYHISFGVFSEQSMRGRSAIWWDVQYGIILRKDKKDIACIGFDIKAKENRIVVVQMQGVKGRSQLLENIRWERMLLDCVIAAAQRIGYREVAVAPASKNKWCKDAEKYNPERLKKFQLRYDVTAKRSGFAWDKERELYCLSLDNTSNA